MELSAWIMIALVFGGLGFYYWYSMERHGGVEGYQKHHLKLREGEKLVKFFFGHYHLDLEKKDVALAAVGMKRGSKTLQIAITDQGRLVFRENATVMADEPVSLEREQVAQIQLSDEEFGGLVGLTEKIEKMRTVFIHLNDGSEIKIDTAKSSAEAIQEWVG